MQCSKCQATITEGVKFCPKCGARAETTAAETGGKRCSQCGTENLANAKFCKKDGYRFDSVAVKPDVPVSPPPVVMPPSEPKAQEAVSKPAPPASDSVTCPKCGAANAPTAKFCKKDGYPLQAAGAAAAPTAMLPPAPAQIAIPPAKPEAIGDPVPPPAPKPAPQPVSAMQAATLRPAVSAAPRAPVIKPAAAKSRKGMIIGAAVGVAILASAGGGYSYWAGYIGNRQGSVQDEINAELGSHGLSNIKVTVSHEWVASLAGTVPNQSEKDQAVGLVSGHKVLKSIVNDVQVESNAADVEKNLNKALAEAGFSSVPTVQIDKDLMATLRGSANDQMEKNRMLALATGVAGVKGVRDEIEIAPETIPEPENPDLAEVAQPSAPPPAPPPLQAQAAPPRTVDKAAMERELNVRLRANGVSGVTGRVNSDMSVALSGTVRSADERYRALTIGGALPGANGVRETIQIAAPQVVKLAPPQAPPPQVAPPAPSPQAAAIDPAKLEGDINRALRSRDINSITAQVSDDMSLTLKGSASAAEKERALQLARQVRGVRGIKDKIFVVE